MSKSMTRRQLIQGLAAMAPAAVAVTIRPTGGSLMAADIGASTAQSPATRTQEFGPLSADVLPDGVRSRFVDNINGLRVHVLRDERHGLHEKLHAVLME